MNFNKNPYIKQISNTNLSSVQNVTADTILLNGVTLADKITQLVNENTHQDAIVSSTLQNYQPRLTSSSSLILGGLTADSINSANINGSKIMANMVSNNVGDYNAILRTIHPSGTKNNRTLDLIDTNSSTNSYTDLAIFPNSDDQTAYLISSTNGGINTGNIAMYSYSNDNNGIVINPTQTYIRGGLNDLFVNKTAGLSYKYNGIDRLNINSNGVLRIDNYLGTSTTKAFQLCDNVGTNRNEIAMLTTSAGDGNYNPMVKANSNVIFGANNATNKSLVLTLHNSIASGLRIENNKVILGYGGTGIDGSSNIVLDGTNIKTTGTLIGNSSITPTNDMEYVQKSYVDGLISSSSSRKLQYNFYKETTTQAVTDPSGNLIHYILTTPYMGTSKLANKIGYTYDVYLNYAGTRQSGSGSSLFLLDVFYYYGLSAAISGIGTVTPYQSSVNGNVWRHSNITTPFSASDVSSTTGGYCAHGTFSCNFSTSVGFGVAVVSQTDSLYSSSGSVQLAFNYHWGVDIPNFSVMNFKPLQFTVINDTKIKVTIGYPNMQNYPLYSQTTKSGWMKNYGFSIKIRNNTGTNFDEWYITDT